MDEVLCADRRTEEQNKKDKDKGARAERKKYVRDAAIGGTFGRILRISTAVVQQWAEEEAGYEHRRHGRSAYRGRESGTLERQ